MIKMLSGVRALTLVAICALASVAFIVGSFAVEAAAQAHKRQFRAAFVRSATVRKVVPRRRYVPGGSGFAAKAPPRPVAKPLYKAVAKPIFKKPVVVARPVARPAPRPVVRPPTPQQLLAARLRALPKNAFSAAVPKPVIIPRAPVQRAAPARPAVRVAALVRPIPIRPAPPKLVKPIALTPTPSPTALPPPRNTGPALVMQKGDWSVFKAVTGDKRTCFAATRPKDSAPRLTDRQPVFLYLTTYAPTDVRNEVTFKLGMPLAVGSSVIAVIDGRNYRLAAKDDMAFPADHAMQRSLLDGLRRGNSLTLRTANPSSETVITDAFSLLGLATALKASDDACAETGNRR
jgi:hypothetical protein